MSRLRARRRGFAGLRPATVHIRGRAVTFDAPDRDTWIEIAEATSGQRPLDESVETMSRVVRRLLGPRQNIALRAEMVAGRLTGEEVINGFNAAAAIWAAEDLGFSD